MFLDNVDVGGVTVKPEFDGLKMPYLLALLNSRLLRWFFPIRQRAISWQLFFSQPSISRPTSYQAG